MPTSTIAPPGTTARRPDPPGLKGLKILVVVLGVLIVVLFAVLVAGMISRIAGLGKSPEADTAASTAPAATAEAVAPFGTASLQRPPGTKLRDVMTSGGLLFFHFHAVDGRDTVVVFDPARRATIGEVAVVDDR